MTRDRHTDRGRPPTVIDVAKAAGVGRSTASRVLGDYGYASEDSRLKVLEAAEKLGYRPNGLARGMITGKTLTVGAVVGDVQNPYFSQLIRAITDAADDAGFNVIVSNSDEDPERERSLVKAMLDKRVDGLIVTPASREVAHLQDAAKVSHLVLADRKVPALNVDTVTIDNYTAAFHATNHLTELGHRRIAIATSARQTPDGTYISPLVERFDGIRAALRNAGAPLDDSAFWVSTWDVPPTDDALPTFMASANPTAIIATDSLVALSVVTAARTAGIAIPHDVSVVTFDDSPWSEALTPPLTVVAQPTHELGLSAMQLLVERINGHDGPPRDISRKATLIARGSTAPPT